MPEPSKLWLLSVQLQKFEGCTMTYCYMAGYRCGNNLAEVKVDFIETVHERKPGFLLDEVQCVEVPHDILRSVLGLSVDSSNE